MAPAVILRHSEILPIYVEDMTLGSQSAPVTAVAFLDRVFQSQPQLEEATLRAWAEVSVRAAAGSASARVFSLRVEDQPRRDAALAVRVGMEGTPEFRINEIGTSGAVEDAEFERVIGLELAAVEQATRRAIPLGNSPQQGAQPASRFERLIRRVLAEKAASVAKLRKL